MESATVTPEGCRKTVSDGARSEMLAKIFLPKPGRSHALELVDRLKYESNLPPWRRFVSRILDKPLLDYIMGVVIIFNMVVMIVETDLSASVDEAISASHWTNVCGWVILTIFVIELAIRLYALQTAFWKDGWNVFDFCIVVVDSVFSLIGLLAGDFFPVSVLRIFRLAKLARVTKVLRVFSELRLLIAGLVSSMSAIFWGTVLLMLCLLVWSMVAVLFIHPLNQKIDYGDGCSRCPRAYSSVMHASLTFWQQIVTGDSWGQATIPLIEAHPITGLYFAAVFLSVGMAVINLILGVVVSVAQTAKETMEEEDHKEEIMMRAERHTHLLLLCTQMDKNGDGMISHEEIMSAFDTPGEFQDCLKLLHVTKNDIEVAWKAIDTSGEGVVPYDDVVSALYTVKSSDTHFMLAYIKHYITLVKESLDKSLADVHKEEVIIEQEVRRASGNLKSTIEKQFDMSERVQTMESGVWQALQSQHEFQVDKQEGAGNPSANVETLRSLSHIDIDICDDSRMWFEQICRRIMLTREELDDILRDMTGKWIPLVPSQSGMTAGVGIERKESDAGTHSVADKNKSGSCSLHGRDSELRPKNDLDMSPPIAITEDSCSGRDARLQFVQL